MSLFNSNIDKYDADCLRILRFISSNYTGMTKKDIDSKNIKIVNKIIDIEQIIAIICNDQEYLLPKDLIDDGWRFGKINGGFYCMHCRNLRSLKGAPDEVNGSFICDGCIKLKSLEGVPRYVNMDFDCSYCNELESLEGIYKIGCNLYCKGCSLLDRAKIDNTLKTISLGGKCVF